MKSFPCCRVITVAVTKNFDMYFQILCYTNNIKGEKIRCTGEKEGAINERSERADWQQQGSQQDEKPDGKPDGSQRKYEDKQQQGEYWRNRSWRSQP
jgi:hypothetical protein